MKLVLVSGFFDPLGIQHIVLLQAAAELGDLLIVGVNSDSCSQRKKNQAPFMPQTDRIQIIQQLRMVDQVLRFDDKDGSACDLIRMVCEEYKDAEIIFANGGDRNPDGDACPEEIFVKHSKFSNRVEMVYGVGGYHKTSSSSDCLRLWVNNTMEKYGQSFRLHGKY